MPQLNGKVEGAPPNKKGFDVNAKIDSATAKKFKEKYDFCIRYISLTPQNVPTDLDNQEASAILDAGLALMPVQHVLEPGWMPSAALGKQYGENAKNNASTVGFPTGVNVWCDLEGVNPSATAQAVIDYCNAWFDAVSQGGYVPGLYVGFDAIVDGNQLSQLKFQHFWKSFSTVPPVVGRGYQMIQSQQITVNGLQIDENTTQNDDKGGQVQWFVKTIPTPPIPEFETVSFDGNLHSGQKLSKGESKGQGVPSPNYFYESKKYPYHVLIMQTDGNLVLYKSNEDRTGMPTWATGTNPNGSYAIMQEDGNLVVYDSNNKPLWASNTDGHPGAQLSVQGDGNAVIYQPVWATNTAGK